MHSLYEDYYLTVLASNLVILSASAAKCLSNYAFSDSKDILKSAKETPEFIYSS